MSEPEALGTTSDYAVLVMDHLDAEDAREELALAAWVQPKNAKRRIADLQDLAARARWVVERFVSAKDKALSGFRRFRAFFERRDRMLREAARKQGKKSVKTGVRFKRG